MSARIQTLDWLNERIDELEARLKESAEDTARLDWLEKYYQFRVSVTTVSGNKQFHIEAEASTMYGNGEGLRAAIDAARGVKK